MQDFTPKKGLSYLLTKRITECTEEEKQYKRLYSAYIKGRYISRQNKIEYDMKTKLYNQQYYQDNREDLLARSIQISRSRRSVE